MEIATHGPFQFLSLFESKQEKPPKGHQWLKQDLIKYAVYLNFSKRGQVNGLQEDFDSWTFFRRLSMFIQCKNPNQCRIFHKKMMANHSSVDSLLSQLKLTIHKFQEWEQQYEPCLSNLQTCLNRQRLELQKELTNKKPKTKIRFDQSLGEAPQVKEQDLKDKDLKPTATEYFDERNDIQVKSSSFQRVTKLVRPPSTLFGDQEIPQDQSFGFWLNKPSLAQTQSISRQMSFGTVSNQEKMLNCQRNFQSYLYQLKSLMEGSLPSY